VVRHHCWRFQPIALSRFASAFDRGTLQDRLIDLMIAAEAVSSTVPPMRRHRLMSILLLISSGLR